MQATHSETDADDDTSTADDSIDTTDSTDTDDRDLTHLECARCGGPYYFDPDADANPHGCLCSDEDEPDGHRLLTKAEALDRAGEYL